MWRVGLVAILSKNVTNITSNLACASNDIDRCIVLIICLTRQPGTHRCIAASVTLCSDCSCRHRSCLQDDVGGCQRGEAVAYYIISLCAFRVLKGIQSVLVHACRTAWKRFVQIVLLRFAASPPCAPPPLEPGARRCNTHRL